MGWTLKKVFECDEIKFGTRFVYTEIGETHSAVIHSKAVKDGRLNFIIQGYLGINSFGGKASSINDSCHFYRPDGSEILPPKEKVKKKYWLASWVDTSGVLRMTWEHELDRLKNRTDLCKIVVQYHEIEREEEL